MKAYTHRSKDELSQIREKLLQEYQEYEAKNLKLDMSRGKPSVEQLELSMGMMDALNSGSDLVSEDGMDCRNYGGLDGIKEAKDLMASMMEVLPEQVIVYGNASLNIMYDTMARSMIHGVMGATPWSKLEQVKFLCPVPGYDRHFSMTESFGIEMIPVSMTESGPDMDLVEALVKEDESIKGIWCVPKYSNPQGISYSDETVKRFARLTPKAADFRIYWDDAYTIHHLYEGQQDQILEILKECEIAGNPDLVYKFASTSKVSFPGAGIAAIATSKKNLEDIKKQLKNQTIGYDKLNQLRHVRFFKDEEGLKKHMAFHAKLIRPKFEAVLEILTSELEGLGIGTWLNPKGGYFISFESIPGCAKAIVNRCKQAGVIMTGAGATYPYGKDPGDSNIRIAPTFPSMDELILATRLFVLCVKLVSVERLLEG